MFRGRKIGNELWDNTKKYGPPLQNLVACQSMSFSLRMQYSLPPYITVCVHLRRCAFVYMSLQYTGVYFLLQSTALAQSSFSLPPSTHDIFVVFLAQNCSLSYSLSHSHRHTCTYIF